VVLVADEDDIAKPKPPRVAGRGCETPALRSLDMSAVETIADDEQRTLVVRRGDVAIAFNFSDQPRIVDGIELAPWGFDIR